MTDHTHAELLVHGLVLFYEKEQVVMNMKAFILIIFAAVLECIRLC